MTTPVVAPLALYSPAGSGTGEFRATSEFSREMVEALTRLADAAARDGVELQRDVLLWQRWIRYSAAGVAAAGVLGFQTGGAVLPVVAVAVLYIAITAAIGWYVRHISSANEAGDLTRMATALPMVVAIVDVAMISALVYLGAPPAQAYRVLLLDFLVVQLAVFYFGWRVGVVAASLSLISFLALSVGLPPAVAGVAPSLFVVGFNAVLFTFICAVLIATIGTYRDRMNRLRVFCKRVEMGDLSGSLELGGTTWADDLTLLARSLGDMRGRLSDMLGTDPMTGCLNRRAFDLRVSREWRQSRRRGSPIALLAIDCDKFKSINDTHGHPVGDLVIQDLAQIMRSTARDTDAVARLGGDEFVVLLPDTAWQGAITFAERLRRQVDEHTFGGTQVALAVTISIGVATARGTDEMTPADLFEEADRSLYRAKSAGRNRIGG